MRVLVGCESSGVVRRAFAARGHFVVSVDLKPPEDGPSKWGTNDYSAGWHYQGNLVDFIYGDAGGLMDAGFDLGIFHPECRYLCNSGALRLYKSGKKDAGRDEDRWHRMYDAASFFIKCHDAPIPKIAVENPTMHGHALTAVGRGRPAQIIQPHQFGEDASKATGLWLRNLPKLVPTRHIAPRNVNGLSRWSNQTDSGQNKLAPSETRPADRARTYPGIATAMAEQWG